jgi:hypothetical protein
VNGFGKIVRTAFQEVRPLLIAYGLLGEFKQGLGGDRVTHRSERTTNAKSGRQSRFQMQIAGAIGLGLRN